MITDGNNFQFNTIRLHNRTTQVQQIKLDIDIDNKMNILGSRQHLLQLQANETRTIPFRFSYAEPQELNWQAIRNQLTLSASNYSSIRSFYVQPKLSTNWKVTLLQPNLVIAGNTAEQSFQLRINNTGNTPGKFTFKLQSSVNGIVADELKPLTLNSGETNIINIPVDITAFNSLRIRSAEILIFIQQENGEQRMVRQIITRIGSVFTGDANSWHGMPLTLEAQLMNAGSAQPFISLGAQGTIQLGNKDQLSVLFRSNNFYDNFSTNTYQSTIQYRHANKTITGGTILDFNHFLIDGNGLRVNVDNDGSKYQLTALRGRFNDRTYLDARQQIRLSKKISWKGNTVALFNRPQETNSYLHISTFDYSINDQSHLQIHAGYGAESFKNRKLDTTTGGLHTGYNYQLNTRRWLIRSAATLYPKNFPGINKGYQYQEHELRLKLNSWSTGPYVETNKRTIHQFSDSLINELLSVDNREYGWRFALQRKKFSLILSPSLLQQLQDSMHDKSIDMHKLAVNVNWRPSDRWLVSWYSNAGKMYTGGAASLFIHNHFMNVQYSNFGIHARWDEGPFYYYEVKKFLQDGQKLRRIQVSPYADITLKKPGVTYRAQLNYLYDGMLTEAQLFQAFHSMQYEISKASLAVSVNVQHDFAGRIPAMFNISVRKQLRVPIVPNKQSHNTSLVLYLDKNNNRSFDEGEQTIPHARISVQGEWVETNSKGQVQIQQVGNGKIIVDFGHIQQLRGWMPVAGNKQQLQIGKKGTTYIAFAPARVISGKILTTLDENSSIVPQLDGIRMTATGEKGELHHTLTNHQGEYYFNLPAGNYLISVNAAAFDEQFRPAESIRTADLVNNTMLTIDFEVRQRKRTINIIRD